MRINIAHFKNAVIGWDIDVNVQAETGQQISQVKVKVNGFPEINDAPGDNVESWEQLLTQKGVFPGDNEVEVLVNDQNGDESQAKQKWS